MTTEEQHKKQVREEVARRHLTSVMNNTKWEELQRGVRERLAFPPAFQTKYVGEEERYPETFEEDVADWGDWVAGIRPYYAVEWIRVRPRCLKHRGALVEPETTDITAPFLKLLAELRIPYREDGESIYIYGYCRDPSALTVGR